MSNEWQQKADEKKKQLLQVDEWIKSHWGELPKGVRRIIIRGENRTKEIIEEYERWAKEDSEKERESNGNR